MKKPTALFDMDGTLADYHNAMVRDMELLASPGESLPHFRYKEEITADTSTGFYALDLDVCERTPHLKARMDLIKRQPGWWLNLDTLQAGFNVLYMALDLGFEPHVLTKGPRNLHNAWAEKLQWIRLRTSIRDITITLDKSLVYGRVLVDDYPRYIKDWLRHRPRGQVIMPDQPWNQDFTHPQAIRYIAGKNDDEVRKALEAQRNR